MQQSWHKRWKLEGLDNVETTRGGAIKEKKLERDLTIHGVQQSGPGDSSSEADEKLPTGPPETAEPRSASCGNAG